MSACHSIQPSQFPWCTEADLIASASRELRAFMCAIRERYGENCAATAGDQWVTVLESVDWELSVSTPDWRKITIETLCTLLSLRLLPLHAVEKM